MATITALSYAYCDFWLWVLHCFLDRPENLSSRFFFIKVSAFDFQEHHDLPAKILTENHLGTIDEVILGTMAAALLVGAWTGPEWKVWAVGVCVSYELLTLHSCIYEFVHSFIYSDRNAVVVVVVVVAGAANMN